MMQRIRMIKDDRAAPEGHTVVTYKAGTEHDAPEWMVKAFIEAGSCELVLPETIDVPVMPAEKFDDTDLAGVEPIEIGPLRTTMDEPDCTTDAAPKASKGRKKKQQ